MTAYRRVTGVAGRSVTLPCYYNGEVTSMCWGRGSCPWFDCGTNIIWTDGYRVTYRRDGRYQLNGNIPGRDVSLTINNAAVSDTGLYCCRIEVRGWFNDIKTTLELKVNPGELIFLLFDHFLWVRRDVFCLILIFVSFSRERKVSYDLVF